MLCDATANNQCELSHRLGDSDMVATKTFPRNGRITAALYATRKKKINDAVAVLVSSMRSDASETCWTSA
jgi:hypothetical protein